MLTAKYPTRQEMVKPFLTAATFRITFHITGKFSLIPPAESLSGRDILANFKLVFHRIYLNLRATTENFTCNIRFIKILKMAQKILKESEKFW